MARETLKVHSKGGFTTIYNLTIRDNNLSNKSLGLLVKLLSLPENWNFSFNGIVAICKDGKRAVKKRIDVNGTIRCCNSPKGNGECEYFGVDKSK